MAPQPIYKSMNDPLSDDGIVISGLSGFFPESDSTREFVDNLYKKKDLVTDDGRRWITEHPEIPRRSGKINVINKFDSTFFSVHYKQAHAMDPMCRMLLEKAYEAIVDAGINPKKLRGSRTGVFIGTCFSETEKTWFYDRISPNGFGITGCSRAMYANRISYWLGVHGPSYSVDTACSSSLYALDHAYRSIRDGLCDYAIVGGSNLLLHPYVSLQFARLGVLSLDGRCKSFDEKANGYARAETVAVAFLQRAKESKRIYSEIIHTKINCDGYKPQGITYPSGAIQQQLLEEFYEECEVPPNTIDFLEAHGTGTLVGDPEEITVIDSVFCTGRNEPLKIGAVKSNCGHSEPASGLCSVTKVCLGMNDGFIPPNINFNEPRKCISALNNGKLQVITEKTKWDGRLVGINSFGFGGANCHVLLRDVYKKKINNGLPQDNIPRLVCVSGRTEEAVTVMLDDLENRPLDAEYVSLFHNIYSDDINGHIYRGYTLLQKEEPRKVLRSSTYVRGEKRPVWFVFSGMGSQWPGMEAQLMKIPAFAKAIYKCHKVLEPKGVNLLKIITEKNSSMFDNILNSFVGIAAIQIGLVDVLTALEIVPDHIIGHSVGELGCAYADGCFTAEQMILAAYYRGLASIELDVIKGSMAAIGLGYNTVRNMCPPEIEIACHNSADSCTVSGPADAMKKFVAELQSKDIFAREVNCSNIAYHSRYIAEAGPRLLEYLKKVIPVPKERSPKWLSTSVPKSDWKTPAAIYSSAEYHTNNLLSSVLFEETARNIQKNAITIEIAPHGLLQAILRRSMSPQVVNISLAQRGHKDNTHILLNSIGKLFEHGLQPNLAAIYPKINYPVSRGTPTISNLVKWEHSDDWHVMKFKKTEKITSGERTVTIDIREEDMLFLMGHMIDGRNLYPATGYLFLVWETFAMMRGKHFMELSAIFENVRFIRATNIPKDAIFEMVVMIQKGSGDFEIVESGTAVVKGRIIATEHPERDLTKLPPIETPQGKDLLPMETRDIYKELRLRGYNYSGLFKSIVECDNHGRKGSILWLNNWVAFMDNMLQMQILKVDTRGLFVPTSIERIVIDCKQHVAEMNAHTVCLDDENNRIELPVSFYHEFNIIKSGGIEIRGLKANAIARRKQLSEPVLEKYQFVPFVTNEKYNVKDALRICLQLILENVKEYRVKVAEIDDGSKEPIATDILVALGDIPLIQSDITVLSSREFKLPDLIKVENKKLSSMDNCLISVGSGLIENTELLQMAASALKDGGFILSREKENTTVETPYGFHIVTDILTDEERFVLLWPSKPPVALTVVNITSEQYKEPFSWLEPLKEGVKQGNLLIVSEHDTYSGILGLVKCLKQESDSTSLRCVFVMDNDAPSFDSELDMYKTQIEKDLSINVYKNGVWGSYRHLLIDSTVKVHSTHAYVNAKSRGDLSSLTWMEGPLQNETNDKTVEIYYSALNFRDIMISTGRIAVEVVAHTRLTEDCVQGLEYSGRDLSGRRIMGMAPGRALGTRIIADKHLMWEFPDEWSLEDAATIPVVYGTVYYGLHLIAKVKKGQSILIHSGSGGVGQAALNIAQFIGMRIFTTVGTEEKRAFLKQRYHLTDNQIGNSRDTSFEQLVLGETNGRGVDVVLNSLAEEKLQASIRCLAIGGKFLEIGKFDLANNSQLGMEMFLKETAFHGVMLDNVFFATESKKIALYNEMVEGLKNGSVKPLVRTVFNEDEVEKAFRYMAAGKHMGKVLIKIRDEESEKNIPPYERIIPAHPKFYAHPQKSYVIIGGLGGFGLELADWLVVRGARKIVISSRHGLTKGYQAYRIRIWRSYNVEIQISTADVSTPEGCTSILHKASLLGPVDAIFNLSVVLRDALFENQTLENFEVSFKGKVLGTQNLDNISRKMCPSLRQFVVFSSVSCGRGNMGQTNYGMANAVMERICEERRKEGLPALAIEWGAVGDVGLVADMQENDVELEIGGTLQQRVTNCLDCMDIFTKQSSPIVASMVVAEKKIGMGVGSTATEVVAVILGIKELKSISMQSNLAELGMDSMMAVEIKQTLEREFEVFLTAQDIRSLTFARLQEIDDMRGTENQQTIDSTGTEGDGLQYILQIAGNEEQASQAIVELGDINSKHTVFLIPGLEGVASIFNSLGSKLSVRAIVPQMILDKYKTVEKIAESLLPIIKDNLKVGDDFNIVGYSYGCMATLEIARQLEAEGYTGKICFVDGSPMLMSEVLNQKIDTENDNKLQVGILCSIMAAISPAETITLKEALDQCPEWENRVDILLNSLPTDFGYSRDYQQRFCNNTYIKLKSVHKYQPNWDIKLKSPAILIKPKNPTVINIADDLGLSDFVEIIKSVSFVDGNHITMLESDKLAQQIQNMVTDTLIYTDPEEIAKKL